MSNVDSDDYMYTTYSAVGYGTPIKGLLDSTKIGDLYVAAFGNDTNASQIAREATAYTGGCLIDKGLNANIKYAKYLIGPDNDYLTAFNYKNFGLTGDETTSFDN